MARKQMARALPMAEVTQVHFAEHGEDALAQLQANPIDLMFLDLTMPVLDGYETLEQLRVRGIECPTIVVSGDIQPEARARVTALGALDFINKPVDSERLLAVLHRFGLLAGTAEAAEVAVSAPAQSGLLPLETSPQSPDECLREVANVAMGQAADKLAQLLKTFITLPIPRVETLSRGELIMTLDSLVGGQHIAVCQGFVAHGLAAEAILSTDLEGMAGLASMLPDHPHGDAGEVAPVLDAAALLVGAFLNGMGQQLDLRFSKSEPVLIQPDELGSEDWQQHLQGLDDTLAIEIPYHFEAQDFVCDLLLMFPGRSAEQIRQRVSYLLDGEAV